MSRNVTLAATLALLLSACPRSPGPSEGAFRPTVTPVECPAGVAVQLLVTYSCATLTTLMDRDAPDGPTIRSLVVTITPSVVSFPDPLLIVGDEAGAVPDYGAHQAEAERLHRVVYVLEQRGTAHGEPSLSCPNLDGDPPATVHGLLAAITSCRAQLVAAGVDPEDFRAAAMAADVEDLREALGVDTWNIESFGSSSAVAFDVLRRYPDHVRAAVIDSPPVPLGDGAGEAAATAFVLRSLFRACRVHPSCRTHYGDLAAIWRGVVAQFRRRTVPSWGGPLAVDDADLIRALRSAVAWDDADVARFPAIVTAASHGRLDPDLATIRATGGAMCVGYRSGCGAGVTTGVALSLLCGPATPARIETDIGLPGVRHAFANEPYRQACDAWTSGVDATAVPSGSPVPVLVVSGSLDPFDPPGWTRAMGRSLGNAQVLIVEGAVHRPLTSSACAVRVRNDWLADPAVPLDASCRSSVFSP